MNYELYLKNILKDEFVSADIISETSNKVLKVKTKTKGILYAKFYKNNSSHIDNELKIYSLVDNKYLKEIYYVSLNKDMAIFKELQGKTIDELTDSELLENKDKIVFSLCDFFEGIGKNKVQGYGMLDENLNGKYVDFHDFLKKRQKQTSLEIKDYKELSNLFNIIYEAYQDIIKPDNSLVPIDTNLKNIMLLDNGDIKFCDPGEMISAPTLMGYGDFAAHTYKTILFDKLMDVLKPSNEEEKLIRIYAIFSSLNILAFLHKNGVEKLDEIIPYGNKYTFYELIDEHVKYLNLKR